MISVGDLRPGMTFQYEGNLYTVLEYSHNKTARAAANIRVKMKNLRTGATTEVTFGNNEKVARAHIDKRKMQVKAVTFAKRSKVTALTAIFNAI